MSKPYNIVKISKLRSLYFSHFGWLVGYFPQDSGLSCYQVPMSPTQYRQEFPGQQEALFPAAYLDRLHVPVFVSGSVLSTTLSCIVSRGPHYCPPGGETEIRVQS